MPFEVGEEVVFYPNGQVRGGAEVAARAARRTGRSRQKPSTQHDQLSLDPQLLKP
jgi:hypothetical protein